MTLPTGVAWTSAHHALKAEKRASRAGARAVQVAASEVKEGENDAETEPNAEGVSELCAGTGMSMMCLERCTVMSLPGNAVTPLSPWTRMSHEPGPATLGIPR